MAFMKPYVYRGDYYEVEANHGETHIVPVDVAGKVKLRGDLAMYVEGRIDDPNALVERKTGWLARMSAPGYMDCTSWSAYATETEALADLAEMYGDDEDSDEEAD